MKTFLTGFSVGEDSVVASEGWRILGDQEVILAEHSLDLTIREKDPYANQVLGTI